MAKNDERSIGTTSFDDYFVQENKEIIEYDK